MPISMSMFRARQRYAMWSQKLNVEIYVAYGEANGHATEALSNVRTVKAMSTELQGDRGRCLLGAPPGGCTVLRLFFLFFFWCCIAVSPGVEPYGMVWYGMVRYGMVRYGMVWYGMV